MESSPHSYPSSHTARMPQYHITPQSTAFMRERSADLETYAILTAGRASATAKRDFGQNRLVNRRYQIRPAVVCLTMVWTLQYRRTILRQRGDYSRSRRPRDLGSPRRRGCGAREATILPQIYAMHREFWVPLISGEAAAFPSEFPLERSRRFAEERQRNSL